MPPEADRFYKVPVSLAAVPNATLPATAKLLWVVLRDRQGSNESCWPGVRRLAAECGLNCETVVEGIRRLEAAGLVDVERRGPGRGSRYHVHESARKLRALGFSERSETPSASARKLRTQALGNSVHNQTKEPDSTRPRSGAGPGRAPGSPPRSAAGGLVAQSILQALAE